MADRGDGRVFQRKGSSRWWIQYNVRGRQIRESAAKTEEGARKKLKARLKEANTERFVGPQAERVTVATLLDGLLAYLRNNGKRSVDKLKSHLMAVRAFFSFRRAVEVTSFEIERFKRHRLDAGRAAATVNRELEGLRQAFNHAARQTPPTFPKHLIPYIPLLPLDNIREGFFERADMEALLAHIPDADIRDFIAWGFRTGMRKSAIAKLTWEMFDPRAFTLTLPGSITKNRARQALKLEGEVRGIMERRMRARRLDCPLIFHRVSKGKPGQPVKDFRRMWENALTDAGLPEGRIFHDLRRSAVRTLIRSGVDPSVAMKVSGHKTRSMLDRYNIIAEAETAAAFAKADAYLSTQPTSRNVERGQFGDNRVAAGAELLTPQQLVAEAGGNRTHRCRY